MRRCQIVFAAILTLVFVITFAGRAQAGDGCCAHCGRNDGCHKVCRLVREEKKVETVCWGCKCEDFWVGGPSKPGCRNCEMVCDSCDEDCDSKTPHANPKKFVWTEWIPCSAKVYTKKKLMKKIEIRKIPSFKWVVEDLCDECEANCDVAEIPHGVEVPPPPVADAKLKYKPAEIPHVQVK